VLQKNFQQEQPQSQDESWFGKVRTTVSREQLWAMHFNLLIGQGLPSFPRWPKIYFCASCEHQVNGSPSLQSFVLLSAVDRLVLSIPPSGLAYTQQEVPSPYAAVVESFGNNHKRSPQLSSHCSWTNCT
jgi:hypothetical protein